MIGDITQRHSHRTDRTGSQLAIESIERNLNVRRAFYANQESGIFKIKIGGGNYLGQHCNVCAVKRLL